MEFRLQRMSHPGLWLAGILIFMLCALGIAAILDVLPDFSSVPRDSPGLEKMQEQRSRELRDAEKAAHPPVRAAEPRLGSAADDGALARCAQCGVVESTRDVLSKPWHKTPAVVPPADAKQAVRADDAIGRDVSIRLDDGSSRMVYQHGTSAWRLGDRVRIVDGALRRY